jgi:hypothetical protein
MVDAVEVEQLLNAGYEVRGFEVKGPGLRRGNKPLVAKVARAVMAMVNLRDGGMVCLGIDDDKQADMLPGLSPEQLGEWTDFDDVTDALALYGDPPVRFDLHPLTLSTGVDVVILEVHEFDDVPHVCKREYPDVLRPGALYIRPRGKPESRSVHSASEMREILDLATDKGLREFIRRVGAAGITLSGLSLTGPSDKDQFDAESALSWAEPSEVVREIDAAGSLSLTIRPEPFDESRVEVGRLQDVLSESTVRLRGWPLPMLDERTEVQRHATWAGQDLDTRPFHHAEAWRFHTSGQFTHKRMLVTDLSEDGQLRPDAPEATGAVAVWDVLLSLVEACELAARLATALKCERISIGATLRGVAGRQLISGVWERDMVGRYIVSANELTVSRALRLEELLADPRRLGAQLARELLAPFGTEVSESVLFDWQEKTLRA